MRVAILGFGQIGGSVARALRQRQGGWSVTAWSRSNAGPARAADEGAIERVARTLDDAVHGADLIVLAAPPIACLELLERVRRAELPSGAVVTDVASTKRRIVERAMQLRLPFIGGHPMAGREATGFDAADPDLFVDRPWIVCPASDDEAPAARVDELARAVGARPVRMDAAGHDAAVAAISHLPLVLSAALVEAVTGDEAGWQAARPLAAGGWASMTRLAGGDAEMGAGILATNADEVTARVRRLREVLDRWLRDLDDGDLDALRRRLEAARAARTDG